MDLSKFEEAKRKLREVKGLVKEKQAAVVAAEKEVDRVKKEIGRADGEVEKEFFRSGGVGIVIYDDTHHGPHEDPFGGIATRVTVAKQGMLASGKVQELSSNDFETHSNPGRRLLDLYRLFQELRRKDRRVAEFGKLFNALCAARILQADDELVAYGGSYFVREGGVWRELGRETEEAE